MSCNENIDRFDSQFYRDYFTERPYNNIYFIGGPASEKYFSENYPHNKKYSSLFEVDYKYKENDACDEFYKFTIIETQYSKDKLYGFLVDFTQKEVMPDIFEDMFSVESYNESILHKSLRKTFIAMWEKQLRQEIDLVDDFFASFKKGDNYMLKWKKGQGYSKQKLGWIEEGWYCTGEHMFLHEYVMEDVLGAALSKAELALACRISEM